MAKSEAKKEEETPQAEEAQKPAAEPQAAPQAQPQQQVVRTQVKVDDDSAVTSYANFCRVTGTPEELIIDVGLNSQPIGPQTESIRINQRLVLNYFTAKRLLAALQMSVQRHEAAFGVLETDVQKRVQPAVAAAAQAQAQAQAQR
ncbi:MAG: DUF3467 domain-containing protein [Planctomycetota bacterium]|nr:DUF3467 domain-containing protein [Planctomycetota bacterium]